VNRFRIVQVHRWLERQRREIGRIDMREAKRRVSDEDMATALFAEVSVTHLRFPVAADNIRTLRDLYVVLLP
jgi:hypothetical protein